MSSATFASQITETAPTVAQLVALGLSTAGAAKMVATYHLAPRAYPLAVDFPIQDEVLALIRTYDVAHFEIGEVTFLASPRSVGSGIQFAVVELDLMVLTETGEVVVVDWQCPTHVMWRCAANGRRFLEALLLTSRFLTLTMLDQVISEDDEFALEVGRSVGVAAGGSEYESFYHMLFGV